MDLKDIKAIIDLMKKNSVSEFELEKQDFKIRLKRGSNGAGPAIYEDSPVLTYVQPPVAAVGTALPATAPAASTAVPSNEVEIKSPMIGTFYRSPSPESASDSDSIERHRSVADRGRSYRSVLLGPTTASAGSFRRQCPATE